MKQGIRAVVLAVAAMTAACGEEESSSTSTSAASTTAASSTAASSTAASSTTGTASSGGSTGSSASASSASSGSTGSTTASSSASAASSSGSGTSSGSTGSSASSSGTSTGSSSTGSSGGSTGTVPTFDCVNAPRSVYADLTVTGTGANNVLTAIRASPTSNPNNVSITQTRSAGTYAIGLSYLGNGSAPGQASFNTGRAPATSNPAVGFSGSTLFDASRATQGYGECDVALCGSGANRQWDRGQGTITFVSRAAGQVVVTVDVPHTARAGGVSQGTVNVAGTLSYCEAP